MTELSFSCRNCRRQSSGAADIANYRATIGCATVGMLLQRHAWVCYGGDVDIDTVGFTWQVHFQLSAARSPWLHKTLRLWEVGPTAFYLQDWLGFVLSTSSCPVWVPGDVVEAPCGVTPVYQGIVLLPAESQRWRRAIAPQQRSVGD